MGSSSDPLHGVASALVADGGAALRSGTDDVLAARARVLHEEAIAMDRRSRQLRDERDLLIRKLRVNDPQRWSYGTLAKVIGCSRELVAAVVKASKKRP